MFYYKETAFFLWFLFWFHQGRIPRHTCRFYCCLAAHQRTRKKDSAEPSFPILWTPPHPPGGIRCGGGDVGCRGLYQYRIPVSGAGRLSPVPNFIWLSVFGLKLFAFQSGCWAWIVRFSLVVDRLFIPAATWCFAFSFVGFALTAGGSFVLFGNGMG